MRPISTLTADEARAVRYVATDVDDTLTIGGKLGPAVLSAFDRLAGAGVRVILITGRPAGYALALATYLPNVAGAVAENGGVLLRGGAWRYASGASERGPELAARLRRCYNRIAKAIPRAIETPDGFTRLTDFAIPREGLAPGDLERIEAIVAEEGLRAVASSIQVHWHGGDYDKGTGLREWLAGEPGGAGARAVMTLGDSPNDQAILDARDFPLSVGVRNLEKYLGELRARPAFLTDGAEGQGFLEAVGALLARRNGEGQA